MIIRSRLLVSTLALTLALAATTRPAVAGPSAPEAPGPSADDTGAPSASRPGMPLVTGFANGEIRGGSQVWALAEDSRGLLFAASNHVVLEFDGTTWRRHVIPERGNATALAIDDRDRVV